MLYEVITHRRVADEAGDEDVGRPVVQCARRRDLLRDWLNEGRARSASAKDISDNGEKIVNIEIA